MSDESTKRRMIRALFPKDRRFKVAYNLMVVARGAHKEEHSIHQYYNFAYPTVAQIFTSFTPWGNRTDAIVEEAMGDKCMPWSDLVLLALFLREAVLSGDIDAN